MSPRKADSLRVVPAREETRVGATPSLGINPAADRRPVKEQPVVASRVRPREKPGCGGRRVVLWLFADGVHPAWVSRRRRSVRSVIILLHIYGLFVFFFYNEYALILSVTARVAERMPYNMYFEKLPTAIISLM